jgi:hypothetical protein
VATTLRKTDHMAQTMKDAQDFYAIETEMKRMQKDFDMSSAH